MASSYGRSSLSGDSYSNAHANSESTGSQLASASLLHKMSKKIAQLTKVVHLLNTKADEHAYMLQCVEAGYEADMDMVLREANQKIEAMRTRFEEINQQREAAALLAGSQGSDDTELRNTKELVHTMKALIDTTKVRHEEEKLELQQSFSRLLSERLKEAEREWAKTTESNVSKLKKDVDSLQKRAETQAARFNEVLDEIEAKHAQNLEQNKRNHEVELATAVRDSTRMVEEMQQRVKRAEKDAADIRQEMQELLKNKTEEQGKKRFSEEELERLLEPWKAKCDTEKARAVRAEAQLKESQAEFELQLKQARSSSTEASQLNQELTAARFQERHLQGLLVESKNRCEEAEKTITGLRKQLEELQHQFGKTSVESERQKDQLEDQLARAKSTIATMSKELQAQEKDISRVIIERDARADALTLARKELEDERGKAHQLREQLRVLQQSEHSKAEQISQLTRDLEQAQRTGGEGDAQLEQLRSQISQSRGLLEQEQARSNSRKEALDAANRRIQAAEASVSSAEEKYKEVSELLDKERKKVKELKRKLELAERSDKEESKRIDSLENQVEEMRKVKESLQAQERKASSILQQKIDELTVAEQELNQLREWKNSYEKDMNDREQATSSIRAELTAEKAQARALEAELVIASSKIESEKNRAAAADSRVKQLEVRIKECEGMTKVAEDRVSQSVERIRTLESELDSLKQAHALEKARISENLTREQQNMVERERILSQLRSRAENAEQALLQAQKSYQEVVQAKEKSEKEVSQANEKISELSSEINTLRVSLTDSQSELATALQGHSEARTELDRLKEISNAKDSSRSSEISDLQIRLRASEAERAKAQSELKDAQAVLTKLRGEHEVTLTRVRRELEAQLAEQAKIHEGRLRDSESRHHRDIEAEVSKAKVAESEKLKQIEAGYQRRIDENENETQSLVQKLRAMEEVIAKMKADFESMAQLQSQRQIELQSQYDSQIRAMEADFRSQSEKLVVNHATQMALQKQDFEAQMNAKEEEFSHLQTKISELLLRLEHRESRPEDLERIQQLLSEVSDLEKQRKQIQEEAKYYKLELINREETYNRKFGGTGVASLSNVSGHNVSSSVSSGNSHLLQAAAKASNVGTGAMSVALSNQSGARRGSNIAAGSNTSSSSGSFASGAPEILVAMPGQLPFALNTKPNQQQARRR